MVIITIHLSCVRYLDIVSFLFRLVNLGEHLSIVMIAACLQVVASGDLLVVVVHMFVLYRELLAQIVRSLMLECWKFAISGTVGGCSVALGRCGVAPQGFEGLEGALVLFIIFLDDLGLLHHVKFASGVGRWLILYSCLFFIGAFNTAIS